MESFERDFLFAAEKFPYKLENSANLFWFFQFVERLPFLSISSRLFFMLCKKFYSQKQRQEIFFSDPIYMLFLTYSLCFEEEFFNPDLLKDLKLNANLGEYIQEVNDPFSRIFPMNWQKKLIQISFVKNLIIIAQNK